MDQDGLRKLVFNASPKKMANALAGLSEKERRVLSTYAKKLHTQISRGELDKEIADFTIDVVFEKLKTTKNSAQLDYDIQFKAQLAVIGLSSLTSAKRIDYWRVADGNEKVLDQVIRDRKPEWLTDLVKHDLEKEFGRFDWPLIYDWICDGLCEPLDTTGYYEQFSITFHGWKYKEEDKYIPISQALASKPALLEREVWGLFKYYTLSFQNDWNEGNKNAPVNYETWPKALLKLSQQNLLDKARLLDESLAALEREFEPHIKSGFHKFHILLNPDLAEIKQRKQRYLILLSQPIGHIVGFSIKMLRQLEKHKQLKLEELLPHISPVMSLSSKTQPIAILKMIKRLSLSDKAHDAKQVEICLNALSHESIDVQEIALSIIENINERNPQKIDDINNYIDFLHPSLRTRLYDLSGEGSPSTEDSIINDNELEENWQCISETIKNLDFQTRQQLGLENYMEDVFSQQLPPPLPWNIHTDFFNEVECIEPIQTLDELILSVSHAVEVVDSADEVERILDGISRLCDQRPPDFERRTEALKNRISGTDYSETARGLVGGYDGITTSLNDLLHTWLTGVSYRSAATNYGVHEFIEQRLQRLSVRVAEQVVAPLLAAPTHQQGWIEPQEFVARILSWQTKDLKLDRYDLIQALLRLSFVGRDQALVNAEKISNKYKGSVIRWALGGNTGPDNKNRIDVDLWMTASRCRFVHESVFNELIPLQLSEHYPDTSVPAVYKWKADVKTVKGYGDSTYSFPRLRIDAQIEESKYEISKKEGVGKLLNRIKEKVADTVGASLPAKQLPSYLLTWFDRKSMYQNANFSSSWLIQWGVMTWPANIDGSMARAARHFVTRLDEKASSYEPNYAFLEPAFFKYVNWTEMVRLAIWTAIISSDADAKGIAIDLFIQGIDDARAHPEPMSETLLLLSEGGWIKPNRLSSTLEQVAQVSDLHRFVCLKILEPYLYKQNENIKNLHLIMELMLALYIELGLQPENYLLEKLKLIKGASKKAKAARALLSIKRNDQNNRWKQTILEVIEGRINSISD